MFMGPNSTELSISNSDNDFFIISNTLIEYAGVISIEKLDKCGVNSLIVANLPKPIKLI